jgi:hypothetical protein
MNTLRFSYLELLVVVGLADGGGVSAKPLKKLLPGTLGMVHDSKALLPGTNCSSGAGAWRGCISKTAEKLLPGTLGMVHDSKVSTWNYLWWRGWRMAAVSRQNR